MPIRNPQELMKMISTFRTQDPKALVTNMVNEAANQGNPVMQGLANLIQNGDAKGIEDVVRNIAKERGVDYDKEFKAFREMFRL